MTNRRLILIVVCMAVSALACGAPAALTEAPAEVTDDPTSGDATEAPLPDDSEQEIATPPTLFLVTPDGGEAYSLPGDYCWRPDNGRDAGLCRDNLWPTELDLAGTYARDETLIFRFKELYPETVSFEMYPIEQLAQGPPQSGSIESYTSPVEDGEAQWPIITVPGSYLVVAHARWPNEDDAEYHFHIDVSFD